MKRVTILCAILLMTVFAVGCSNQKAPTELSEDVFRDNVRLGKGAPVEVPFFSEIQAFNPCTETSVDVTITGTLKVHSFVKDDGRHHVNIQQDLDLVTSDGFSGRSVGPFFIDNGTGDVAEEFSFTTINNVNLSNDSGQRIIAHFLTHITIRNGQIVRAFIDKVSLECVGKPDGA